MSQYKDITYCPHCDEETEQIFESFDHEQGSSSDMQTCTFCHWWRSGNMDEWACPIEEEGEPYY